MNDYPPPPPTQRKCQHEELETRELYNLTLIFFKVHLLIIQDFSVNLVTFNYVPGMVLKRL